MTLVPERDKKPGVCYAVSDDGLELPVVDITHPAFALDGGEAELAEIAAASLRGLEKSMRMPVFVRRLLARRSILVRGTLDASGTFVSGMTTYLYKLGPDNLGAAYAGDIDRQLAGTISPVAIRMRLRETSRLIADGLAPALAARPGRPVHLLNIGGGPAADSLNSLLLLRKEHPDWLVGRPIYIHVLDIDQAGPRFGTRALAALLEPGAPLHGLEATFEHVESDWNDVSVLREVIGRIATDAAVVAGSSEGGLFEYGSDAAILANLEVLRKGTQDDFFLVGSALRDEEISQAIRAAGEIPLRLFDLETFRGLVERAGWTVDRSIDGNPLYHVVSLQKIRP